MPASASGVRRFWLGWTQPPLLAAAAWLLDHASTPGDCSGIVCVLPGRRAGRTLLRRMVEDAANRRVPLIPPRITTPGAFIPLLAGRTLAAATDVESLLAWHAAILAADPALVSVISPTLPESARAGLRLAAMLQRLRHELAGECRTCLHVADQCERLERLNEADRWHAIAGIEALYLEALRNRGLLDPDDAQSKLVDHIKPDGPQVVLIGVADLTARQRLAIGRAGADALIHAPESLADAFDDLGCVRAEHWTLAPIGLAPEHIVPVVSIDDQPQELLRRISTLNGEVSTDEIIIGLGDEAEAPMITIAGEWAEVPLRAAAGVAFSRTSLHLLLSAIADFLEAPAFRAFAALVRHPDLERLLGAAEGATPGGSADAAIAWETLLDRYYTEHLQQDLSRSWLGDQELADRLRSLWRTLATLLQPVAESHDSAGFARALNEVLDVIYPEPPRHPLNAAALDACREAIDRLSTCCVDPPRALTPAESLRLLLDLLSGERVAIAPDGEIEMVGWLELQLDESPVALITSVNERMIPSSVLSDAFLPDSLRAALGLVSDRRRHARDAYQLTTLVQTKRVLRLLTPRQDREGSPLPPSRLLLQCPPDALPARLKDLLGAALPSSQTPIGLRPAPESTDRVPALPEPQRTLEWMRVTDFGRYLRCPYRFALERLHGLSEISDASRELSPSQLGSLLHRILDDFGKSPPPVRFSTDAARIEEFVLDVLQQHADRHFGEFPAPTIRVQLARMRQRLAAFARHQSALAREGWRIVTTEAPLPDAAVLTPEGQVAMRIHGTIDRIDQFRGTSRFRLIDYKSSDRGETPLTTHHGGEKADRCTWIDLQLPLYLHFAPLLSCAGMLEAGYFNLPRSSARAGFCAAPWSAAELASALAKAHEVICLIREGRFAPNPQWAQAFDPYARILRTEVWDGDAGEEAEE